MEGIENTPKQPVPKFSIGDTVWQARAGQESYTVPCPDCFGKKKLTVILGDDSEVIIPCVGCSERIGSYGSEVSTGLVKRYRFSCSPSMVTIRGVEIEPFGSGQIRYNSFLYENDLFETEVEAAERSRELAETEARNEQVRFFAKEKPERDWAWHVHYHRDCIKRAERDLAWHRAKIEIALMKKKSGEKEKRG